MGRWLSIDYGSKRIGLAITDQLQMFVMPFTTILNKSDEFVFESLLTIIKEQDISKIIIGLPIGLEGNDTFKTKEVREFSEKISTQIKTEVTLFDERFSTHDANDFLKEKKITWKESRKIVDQIAAAVILRNYLSMTKIKERYG